MKRWSASAKLQPTLPYASSSSTHDTRHHGSLHCTRAEVASEVQASRRACAPPAASRPSAIRLSGGALHAPRPQTTMLTATARQPESPLRRPLQLAYLHRRGHLIQLERHGLRVKSTYLHDLEHIHQPGGGLHTGLHCHTIHYRTPWYQPVSASSTPFPTRPQLPPATADR